MTEIDNYANDLLATLSEELEIPLDLLTEGVVGSQVFVTYARAAVQAIIEGREFE